MRIITQKQIEERLELHKNGLSDIEIAEKLNMTRNGIRTWRKNLKLPPNRFKKPIRIKEISEKDKIYIAGFFDGEGYAGIGYNNRKNDSLCPNIQITNTNKNVILWIKKAIGISNKIIVHDKKTYKNHKYDYRICITGLNDVKYFAEQMIDYCIVKKEILSLVKKFCENRLNKPAHSHFTNEDYKMYEKSRELNKRGRF